MELYTLTSHFLPKESVDEFTSAIWTERYYSAGDVQLVVSPVPSMIELLAPGTFLGLRGTSEIMQIKSQSIENGLLTVIGTSMPEYLNQRQAWFKNATYDGSDPAVPKAAERSEDTTAGQLISSAVYETAISPTPFSTLWSSINLDWTNDKIPGLALGRIDTNGAVKRLTFPLGPLYDGIQKLAQDEGVGIKLYLESATYPSGFVFRFATYRGRDRTSEQTVRTMVRLTPKMDSLNEVKEIRSVDAYKNVFYVSYKNVISTHYIPGLGVPTGFNRRAVLVEAPDIFLLPEHIAAFREQVARNAIANHVYVQAVDGRVSSKIPYTYAVDYSLGDVIELEGYTEVYSKARVTEYIRSQDQYGEQEYPTLTVLDPLFIGYMPDLEPGNEDWPWEDDPAYLGDDPEANRQRRQKHPKDPIDHNPDPEPVFPPGSGGGGGGTEILSGTYLTLGYFPDHDNGEALAYLKFSGELISAWVYEPEDTSPDANTSWLEVEPVGWTFDKQKLIARSREDKLITPEYPWRHGYSYWIVNGDGTQKRLTSPKADTDRPTNPGGGTHGWSPPGVIWAGSDSEWRWYLMSDNTIPSEYVYADGTYSTNPNLQEDPYEPAHGDVVGRQKGPIELYAASSSSNVIEPSSMTKVLGSDKFPTHMRWSGMYGPYVSPNGNKLVVNRRLSAPDTRWQISWGGLGAPTGGTFDLILGKFGDLSSSWATFPIPWNATAQEVWIKINELITYVSDPRDRGYPGLPYSGGPLPNSAVTVVFDSTVPEGLWIISNSSLIESSFVGAYPITYGFGEIGPTRWFLCDNDGSNFDEIDLGGKLSGFCGWSPDSTKLHALAPSESGHEYCRWMNYDVATGDITYPLDYTSNPLDAYDQGPLKFPPWFSPDSQKIAWVTLAPDGTKSLWVADADGTGKTEVYQQTVDDYSTNQDALVLGSNKIAWSFDSNHLAMVDRRNETPVWMIDVRTNVMTKIYPGSGWDDSSQQKWFYDLLDFDKG